MLDRPWVRIAIGLLVGLPVTLLMGIVSLLGFGTGLALFVTVAFRNPSDFSGLLFALGMIVLGLSGMAGIGRASAPEEPGSTPTP